MFSHVTKIPYKDSTVYIMNFKNLDHFLEEVKDDFELNPIFENEHSLTGDASFTGTSSYEEAWKLCRFTMNKGFEQFYKKFQSLNYKLSYHEKKIDSFSVVGYVPSVPRYLLGIPTSMHSYRTEKEEKAIHIYMNMAYSCYQNEKQIENRGLIVLNLVTYLESRGYKVDLFTYEFSACDDEKILITVPIKTALEKLNIKKAYFPLVHPSFLRRLLFRAKEKMPVKNWEWKYGYGYPMEYQEAVQFFDYYHPDFEKEKTLYISTPSEMGVKGENLDLDFDRFLETLNTNYQNREKQKVKTKG